MSLLDDVGRVTVFAFQELPVNINWITREGAMLRRDTIPFNAETSPEEVTRYRLDVMDPNSNRGWVEHVWLSDGTTPEQAGVAFNNAADALDIRVRLVVCREKPLAIASAKI